LASLEDLHVACVLIPRTRGDDLEDASFYDVLTRRFGHTIVSASLSVEPS
jgi:hypothetical protein